MNKLLITDLDKEACEGRTVDWNVAKKRIVQLIHDKYDSTLPEKEFLDWIDQPDEPFRHNKVLYFWDELDVTNRLVRRREA